MQKSLPECALVPKLDVQEHRGKEEGERQFLERGIAKPQDPHTLLGTVRSSIFFVRQYWNGEEEEEKNEEEKEERRAAKLTRR